jgi:hypothetical protein
MDKSAIGRRAVIVLLVSIVLIAGGVLWSMRDQRSGIAIAIVGLLVLLYGCIFVFPVLFTDLSRRSQPDTTYQKTSLEYLGLVNDVRGTLLQVVLGIGVLAAAVSAWSQFLNAAEQLDLTRDQFVSGEFSSATELLSKPELESRLGGLYTLQRLTRTATNERIRQDSLISYQLLAAFVKAHSPWPPQSLDKDQERRGIDRYNPLEIESLRKRAADVQLALEIVGAREKLLPRGETYAAFLTDTDLRGATLKNLDLSSADLRETFLDYSNSRFSKSDPNSANSSYPNFSMANLQDASLRCAHLEGTNFQEAQLQRADLRDTDLRAFPPPPGKPPTQKDADLSGADLEGVTWNGLTQWPQNFDVAKHPELGPPDDELLARPIDGKGAIVYLVKGGTVDWEGRENWKGDKPVSEPIVKGGEVIGILNGKTWRPTQKHLTEDLSPVTCGEYGKYNTWPGSVNLYCGGRPDRACLEPSQPSTYQSKQKSKQK